VVDLHDITINPFSASAFRMRVEERFKSRADILAATGGDMALNPGFEPLVNVADLKPAAVLIAIISRNNHATVLLTQRTEHLSSHGGQVAFPGGKIDEGETAVEAALREADEEVGLKANNIEVLGAFGPYHSGSGYHITPVVGMVKGEPDLVVNEDEVADTFEVPLAHLMSQEKHTVNSRFWNEREVFFYTIPYNDSGKERHIWGVTAGIIRMVQERLYGA